MSDKKFDSLAAFREHLRLGEGETARFPMTDPATPWTVVVADGEVRLESPWYRVVPAGKFRAASIQSPTFDFGGQMASGVVEFGIGDEGLKVLNRRSLNAKDTFPSDRTLVTVTTNAQPDRLSGEPVAVIIETGLRDRLAGLTPTERLAAYGRVRDGLEMEALRCLFLWADAA